MFLVVFFHRSILSFLSSRTSTIDWSKQHKANRFLLVAIFTVEYVLLTVIYSMLFALSGYNFILKFIKFCFSDEQKQCHFIFIRNVQIYFLISYFSTPVDKIQFKIAHFFTFWLNLIVIFTHLFVWLHIFAYIFCYLKVQQLNRTNIWSSEGRGHRVVVFACGQHNFI